MEFTQIPNWAIQHASQIEGNQGWIYILSDRLGHYKIGKTSTLDARIKQLKIQLPYQIEVIAIEWVSDRHEAEKILHQSYKYARMNGEWFSLDNEDLKWLQRDLQEIAGEHTSLDDHRLKIESALYDGDDQADLIAFVDEMEFEQEFSSAYLEILWQREREGAHVV